MSEQTWSRLKPTEAGFYWLRIVEGSDAGDYLVAMNKTIEASGGKYLACRGVLMNGINTGWSIEAKAEEPTEGDELEAGSLWCGPLKPPAKVPPIA
jgi:hypothetical protein